MTAAEASAWRESGADEMFRLSFEESMQAQEAVRATDMQREALKANLTSQLMATNRYTPEQAEVNAELAAAGYASMAQRSGMSIDELYGLMPLNVVSDGLNVEGFDQALASNPPRGWVHVQDGAAAADLWNGSSQAQAVFWTGIKSRAHDFLPETEGYSHSISADTIRHMQNRHGNDKDGQLPVTADDVAKIPEIIADADAVIQGNDNPDNGGKRAIYAKKTDDGLLIYIEEARKNRKDFKGVTMWKYPLSADVGKVLEHVSRPSLYAQNEIAAYLNDTPADTENQLFQSAFDGTPQESFNRTAEALGGEAAYAQAVSDGL